MIRRADVAKLITRVYMLPDSDWDVEMIMPSGETLKGYVGKVEAGYYATKLSIILETEKEESIERWLNDCHIENDGTYRGGEDEKDSNSI